MGKIHKSSKISALVVCFNKEQIDKVYLENLSFAHEIIIIEYSTVAKKIATVNEFELNYLENNFSNFSEQLTFAITTAKNDWILLLDFDEMISSKLKEEVLTASTNEKNKAYYLNQNFVFFGKNIKHGGFRNKKTIRLFNKHYCQVNTDLVDSAIKTSEKTAVLKHHIDDCSYKGFDPYNMKLNMFSQIKMENLFKKNIKPNFYHFLIKPILKFNHQYFFKLGLLDGKEGYILAYIHSFAVLKCYLLLWLKYKKME